jgi:hypothetical protein
VTGVAARYWESLSPALQRYYWASVWPSLAFVALAALHEWAARQPGLATSLRIACALAPVLAMAWMFAAYLRFLRDCDELERRIELGALAWAAGIVLQASMAAMLLLDADLVDWSGRHVAASLGLLLVVSYAFIRGWLHRRYS